MGWFLFSQSQMGKKEKEEKKKKEGKMVKGVFFFLSFFMGFEKDTEF